MDRLEPDRIERELRDVLTHERRALSPDLVSLDAVYAGAARRRRRRTAVVAAAGAFVLLAGAAVPLSIAAARGRPATRSAPDHCERRTDRPDTAAHADHVTVVTANRPPRRPRPARRPGVGRRPRDVDDGDEHPDHRRARCPRQHRQPARHPTACVSRRVATADGRSRALSIPDDALAGGTGATLRRSATNVRFGSARDGWLYRRRAVGDPRRRLVVARGPDEWRRQQPRRGARRGLGAGQRQRAATTSTSGRHRSGPTRGRGSPTSRSPRRRRDRVRLARDRARRRADLEGVGQQGRRHVRRSPEPVHVGHGRAALCQRLALGQVRDRHGRRTS